MLTPTNLFLSGWKHLFFWQKNLGRRLLWKTSIGSGIKTLCAAGKTTWEECLCPLNVLQYGGCFVFIFKILSCGNQFENLGNFSLLGRALPKMKRHAFFPLVLQRSWVPHPLTQISRSGKSTFQSRNVFFDLKWAIAYPDCDPIQKISDVGFFPKYRINVC